MKVLETERLALRHLTEDDAPFMLELLNEPSFLRFIGDRKVRTVDDARAYILKGPAEMYERHGHGLYLASLKEEGTPIGMCGLNRREGLEDVDIGFAFRPAFWGRGYAFEAASAVFAYGRSALGLRRIVAITVPDNQSSIRLLEKIGLTFEGMTRLHPEGPEVRLFGWNAGDAPR
jgi:RimJ/RimL family protein N-acetyltransferase